jgi:hypothetical protein
LVSMLGAGLTLPSTDATVTSWIMRANYHARWRAAACGCGKP